MKKILIILIGTLLTVTGCEKNELKQETKLGDIKGHWILIKEDDSGNITDYTKNKNSYLKVTEDEIIFYTYYSDTNTHAESSKYYKLDGNKMYYDYYELKGKDWKDNIDDLYGGIFYISLEDDSLIIMKYLNKKDKTDGWNEETYEKVDISSWPIEE